MVGRAALSWRLDLTPDGLVITARARDRTRVSLRIGCRSEGRQGLGAEAALQSLVGRHAVVKRWGPPSRPINVTASDWSPRHTHRRKHNRQQEGCEHGRGPPASKWLTGVVPHGVGTSLNANGRSVAAPITPSSGAGGRRDALALSSCRGSRSSFGPESARSECG